MDESNVRQIIREVLEESFKDDKKSLPLKMRMKLKSKGISDSQLEYNMKRGLPYDSDAGRALAGGITAFIHSTAYHQSAELAEIQGPFERYSANAEHIGRC